MAKTKKIAAKSRVPIRDFEGAVKNEFFYSPLFLSREKLQKKRTKNAWVIDRRKYLGYNIVEDQF